MFPDACQLLNLAWRQLGLNMKNVACHKPMKHEQHLICLQAFTRAIDHYNAIEAQVYLAKFPQDTANILHNDIFCFFLKHEEFVSKPINDSSVDLDKFPTSKIRQLAKKMEHPRQLPDTSRR